MANASTSYVAADALAKNVVSIGGLRHQDTFEHTDDRWCPAQPTCPLTACASIGPAPYQRVKPDLTHFNDCTYATDNDCNSCYANFGGTSGATPITCGYFGLLFQMWHEQVFPGFGGGASVFASRPHMTTAKAMMINTAYRYPLVFPGDFTRYNQGWGMVDVAALYAARNNMLIINETDLLTVLQTRSYNFTVQSGDPALRVTLVYADPPGSPCYFQPTLNDLSLKVVSPSGSVYWGNHGLITANWSSPDPTPLTRNYGVEWDFTNTVENVFVTTPQTGTWTVTVIADAINQDGHAETAGEPWDADYALVVSSAARPKGRCCYDNCDTFERSCSYTTPAACTGQWYTWFSEQRCSDPCPHLCPEPNFPAP
jgi:hypothetical protein